jgi:glycosyltransferase involved in cell wall biosynthesis
VVVDDGSTDGTEDLVRKMQNVTNDTPGFHLEYIRQANSGAAAARNRGLQAASGAYVRFLDSDDYLYSDATPLQVQMLEASGSSVCYGGWRDSLVDEKSGLRHERIPELKEMTDPIAAILGDEWRPPFCYLIRRETVIRSGGWDETYRVVDDVKFILRVAYLGETFVGVSATAGCYIRHHGARISTANWSAWVAEMGRILSDGIVFLDSHNTWTEVRRSAVAAGLFDQARRYYGFDREQFHECIRRMLALHPTFRPPGAAYRLCVRGIGYERTEGLRGFCKKCLKSVGLMASGA